MQNTSWTSDLASGSKSCLDRFHTQLCIIREKIFFLIPHSAIQWTYQTCNEFGFYQTSNDKAKMFGDRFPLVFFVKQCTDIYGKQFDADTLSNSIDSTNTEYGALHPNTTNVLYVHGSIDPWHALGLIDTNNPALPTIYIEGTAHCANMYEPKDTDFPQLKEARNKIRNYLRDLLH